MLWQASESRRQQSAMWQFLTHISQSYPLSSQDHKGLHQFSIEHPGTFWRELVEFFPVKFQGSIEPECTDAGFSTYGWFPEMRLNFAENLLANGDDQQVAIKSLLENGDSQSLTYGELKARVAAFQNQLSGCIAEGDVLACYMPNIAETVIAMLAATGLGGVFTSTSADFGVDGVVDRFGQSKPKVLVACAGYEYGGKYFDVMPKLAEVVAQLETLEKVVVVDRYQRSPDISQLPKAEWWTTEPGTAADVRYVSRAFADPLYIMYSSGTTGKPKCIVHATGGVLLQHIKELGLHTDHNASKNIFFFTTCGWMMWNWLISSLFFGGTTTLYEGSPGYPSFTDFINRLAAERVNIFGTSPKYLKALEDSDTRLADLDLSQVETFLSTGSPLLPEQYDFVYNRLKKDVMLASISGGTDIVGCFFLGNPLMPVYRGELQCAGLGMDVACLNDKGEAVVDQEGELVCRQSFPSRPIYFLNDPDNARLRDAYFNTYPGLWYHGDFIKITSRGGALFFGRSDATLNPGGVRIGTSEIYRQTETLGYIEDTVCVGHQLDGDVDVVLFVKMKPGETLSDKRIVEIKQRIKVNTTPRHVPRHVIAITDIPYTRSGKKIELAVSKLINGKTITNQEAIANPECLEEYRSIRIAD